jgi:hypothetical protein
MKLRAGDPEFNAGRPDPSRTREVQVQDLQVLQGRLTKLTVRERLLMCGMLSITTVVLILLGAWMHSRL